MAFIIGIVSPGELEDLRARGWDDEDPPAEMVEPTQSGYVWRMFFVDSNVHTVMTGPDWEPAPKAGGVDDGK